MTDDLARERIRTELASTLFVEAGAGTGKTTALVGRILEGITSGSFMIREVAAITFTERAAGELRDRVTLALEHASHHRTNSEERGRAAAALGALDDAVITTIHGFAQRICAEWAPSAGLPPGFDVRDDIAASVAFDRAWRRFLDDWYAESDAAELLQVAAILGATPHHFRGIALALAAHVDRLSAGSTVASAWPGLDLTPVMDEIELAVSCASDCTDPDDLLLAHLARLERFAHRLRRAGASDPLDALDVLVRGPKIPSTRGKAKAWPDKAAVLEALQRAEDARRAVLAPIRSATIRTVTARIAQFTVTQAAERVHNGTLEFDDLLRVARTVLRDHAEVRRATAERWRFLAIDEFQDTDPLQVEIALLLADANAASVEQSAWGQLTLADGRLFLVGDPKQSIYRFRRADLALYRDVVEAVPGESVALSRNFRTTAPIIDWVNTAIAALMSSGGPEQAPWRPLVAHRGDLPADSGPPVALLGGPRGGPGTGVGADEIRALEAETIAATISHIVGDGWRVHDSDSDAWRPARLGDIAILVPTRAPVRALERALEQTGIPLRIESRSLLWDMPEVHDLLLVLRAIDDPADELAVVGALRSPAFGCTDRELLEFVRAGGRFGPRRLPEHVGDHTTIVGALDWIHARHDERWWTPINHVVERTLRERHCFAAALATPRARDRWRRLRFVLEQARAFSEQGGASLRSFLDWVDDQTRHRAQVNDAIAPDPDDDAVRVLTAHAAKGLEFPIVLLAGWNQAETDSADPVLFSPVHPGAFEVRVGARDLELATRGYEGLVQPELAELRAERDRLLYVAATRARDHLLVSLFHKAGTKCDAARLCEAMDGAADEVATFDESLRPLSIAAITPPTAAQWTFDASAWMQRRADLLAAATRAPAIAATALAHDLGEPNDRAAPPADNDDDEAPTTRWRRGRAGTAIGRAVHAVLQTVDLLDAHDLESLAIAHCVAEGVPEHRGDVMKLARSALAAPMVQRARHAKRVWREIPVGAPIGDVILEGYVDLCFEDDDGLVIIDYKTDAVTGETALATAVDRYTPQAGAYAAVLEAVLGRPVKDCALVFCRPGSAVEVPIPNLHEVVAAVRRSLTGPHGSAHGPSGPADA